MSNFDDNRQFYVNPHSLNSQAFQRGSLQPVRVKDVPSDTCVFTINSSDRMSGTDYNFTVSCQKPILNPIKAQVTRASIPKIPNINANNNTMIIWHVASSNPVVVTIPIGYYNQNSLVTAIATAINTNIIIEAIPDMFAVNFNTLNKTISITSSGGYKWYFDSNCSFILYGYNVANFQSYPAGTDKSVYGQVSWYSGNCGLLYSRYVSIRSNALCAHAYDTSRTSSGLTNTIAVISMVNAYDSSDFSVNNVYQGNIILDDTVKVSSILNIAQSGAQIQVIDISVTDEFGFDLGTSLNLGTVPGTSYSYNSSELGLLIWITITL